jgi:hypothetical protein
MGTVGASARTASVWPAYLILAGAVLGCAAYANLSHLVSHSEDYRFFPPFQPHVNRNDNGLLGAESFTLARSLADGEGYANLMGPRSGPTAWIAPVLPALEAGLLWACGGSKDEVQEIVVLLQALTLVGTGVLVLALLQKTAGSGGTLVVWAGVGVFLGLLCCGHFYLAFQQTHDHWLVLLLLDVLIAWLSWGQPLHSLSAALAWGAFGGLCALVSPIVALVWVSLALGAGWRRRTWVRLSVAVGMAGIVVLPWIVRNYLVFGRLIPIKSNLAFELYQSQVVEPDGVLSSKAWKHHPYLAGEEERMAYRRSGEMAYVDQKWQQFRQAVEDHPADYAVRLGWRFLATTLVYVPFDRTEAQERPWSWWLCQLTYALPFLSLLYLLVSARRQPLDPAMKMIMGAYLLYLAPYVAISYYDRYGFPLVGMKSLLVVWAGSRLTRRVSLGRLRLGGR